MEHHGIVFRLYTEDLPGLHTVVASHFDGATLYLATGLWRGTLESSRVVEIYATLRDLPRILNLAHDIRETNNQTAVLVTWAPTSALEVTAETVFRAPEAAE
jgi:hypothetical protein